MVRSKSRVSQPSSIDSPEKWFCGHTFFIWCRHELKMRGKWSHASFQWPMWEEKKRINARSRGEATSSAEIETFWPREIPQEKNKMFWAHNFWVRGRHELKIRGKWSHDSSYGPMWNFLFFMESCQMVDFWVKLNFLVQNWEKRGSDIFSTKSPIENF